MSIEQVDTAALVERAKKAALRIRPSVTVPATMEERAEAEAVIDSLTAALERAERERDEEREKFRLHVETMIEPKLLARAQKAETVVEAARRLTGYTFGFLPQRDFYALRQALTAYDEPPSDRATV